MPFFVPSLKSSRKYLPLSFELQTVDQLESVLYPLVDRPLSDDASFHQWIQDWNEVVCCVLEEMAKRYIDSTCDTRDEAKQKAYEFIIQSILPVFSLTTEKLHQKLLAFPGLSELEKKTEWHILIRNIRTATELFREENIPLQTEISTLAQQFGVINGEMSIEWEGQALTLQQAARLMKNKDRNLRENAWRKMTERRLQDSQRLDDLMDQLLQRRHQEALQAGFENYAVYKFKELGRFDYTLQDCFTFHDSVEKVITPINQQLLQERAAILNLTRTRPWDLAVELYSDTPLHPFSNGKELADKGIEIFGLLSPDLGEMLNVLKTMGHLDLDSRQGKAPGGYNYPLAETGVPFIFMNAAGSDHDVATLMHEGGHAIHSLVTHSLPLQAFKETPSEIAELASMSMEFLTRKYWSVFYPNPRELNVALIEHLLDALSTVTWIATIDAFQHWMYTHPGHTSAQRDEAWRNLYYRFQGKFTDWTDLDKSLDKLWQKQLHLYEVPFYYIEYGFAQLGALAIWKRFQENPEQTISDYLNALRLGYTRTIPEVYAAAGIRFDFSQAYIQELMQYGLAEYRKLATQLS